jgi:hypothetical protein
MANAEKIERGYLGTLLRLTLLAPDIVKAILDGRQPADLNLLRLLESFSTEWPVQRRTLPNTGAAHQCLHAEPSVHGSRHSGSSPP